MEVMICKINYKKFHQFINPRGQKKSSQIGVNFWRKKTYYEYFLIITSWSDNLIKQRGSKLVHRIDLIKTNAVKKSRRNIVLTSIVKIFRITAVECALINPCRWPFVYFWSPWAVVCMSDSFVGFSLSCKCMTASFLKKGRGRLNRKLDK